jgi:hypothetical protein
MHRVVRGAAVLVGTGAGVVAVRRITAVRRSGNGPGPRWHAVTVNRPEAEVAPDGRLPDPLGGLGDMIEVRLRPAPGERGTELHARLRVPEPAGVRGAAARATGNDPRQRLRAALRQAKQLVETGEVLQADRPPTTRRTLRGLPLELATRRAQGEGRL